MKKLIAAFSSILLLVLTLSSVHANVAQKENSYLSDSAITTQVKSSLLKHQLVDGEDYSTWNIHVETVNGVVILKGKVHSEQEREQAQQIAAAIKDVKSVKNELKIEP